MSSLCLRCPSMRRPLPPKANNRHPPLSPPRRNCKNPTRCLLAATKKILSRHTCRPLGGQLLQHLLTQRRCRLRLSGYQPQSFTNESLPSPLLLLLDSIKSSLRSLFTSKPPHTIQRLAELILYPTVHYRTLPAYLRALDRVVCVTSSAEVFPLQIQASMSQPNGVTNGGGSSGLLFDHAPGSDESLGGALLTPIPWLSNAISFEDEAGEPSNEGTVSHTVIDGPFFNSATKTKANNNRHRIRFHRHTPRDPPGTTTPARTASRTQPRARDNHHHARNNNTTHPPPGHTSHRKRSHGRHHVPSTR